jgi:hypothetical protein
MDAQNRQVTNIRLGRDCFMLDIGDSKFSLIDACRKRSCGDLCCLYSKAVHSRRSTVKGSDVPPEGNIRHR